VLFNDKGATAVRIRFPFAIILLLVPALTGCQSALILRSSSAPTFHDDDWNGEECGETPPEVFVREAAYEPTDDAGQVSTVQPLQSSPPTGVQSTTVSLSDLEAIALDNNPTLSAAAARIDDAQGRLRQAGRYPNPVIGYHATEIGNQGTAGQQGGFVGQRFVTAGKLKLDKEIASRDVDETHFRWHVQEQRVLSDVRLRFYDAIVAQQRVELASEFARIGQSIVEATEKLQANHLRTENDVLQGEVRAEQANIVLDNARNEQLESWRRLAAVIGMPTMKKPMLAGELSANQTRLNWDDCYAKVLGSNPELSAARSHVEREKAAIRRAELESIPNLDFSLSVRHHNVTSDNVANVQVGMPIPLFDRNRGNIQSAKARWIGAMNEVDRIELHLQDRLAIAFRRYSNASQQTERYQQRIIPRAKRSLDLVANGYDAGKVDFVTLLTAKQTHLQVSLAHLDSLGELWKASTAIDGQLLDGSLSPSPSPKTKRNTLTN